MRIIAGKYKGRALVSFKAEHIRPTTDRVKGSLFNILQTEIEGARVLDLFSGTGNLALEALSRGAQEVTAVESHRESVAIIRKNTDLLKVGKEFKLVPIDVFKYLKSVNEPAFDLIFVDPPFTEALGHQVMEAIANSTAIKLNTIVAIETGTKERIEDQYPPLTLTDRRDYGDKSLLFFTCNSR